MGSYVAQEKFLSPPLAACVHPQKFTKTKSSWIRLFLSQAGEQRARLMKRDGKSLSCLGQSKSGG